MGNWSEAESEVRGGDGIPEKAEGAVDAGREGMAGTHGMAGADGATMRWDPCVPAVGGGERIAVAKEAIVERAFDAAARRDLTVPVAVTSKAADEGDPSGTASASRWETYAGAQFVISAGVEAADEVVEMVTEAGEGGSVDTAGHATDACSPAEVAVDKGCREAVEVLPLDAKDESDSNDCTLVSPLGGAISLGAR